VSWTPNEKEIQSVLALPARERYAHCVKRIADEERLWSLRKRDGWVLMGDEAGPEVIPVWPHSKYAARCATGEWQGALPTEIALDAWFERWIPGLRKVGRLVGVFPLPHGKAIVVEPDRFERELREELKHYD